MEQLLDIAHTTAATSGDMFLLIDRSDQLRIISSVGWSLPGVIGEFGAAEVFQIRRRADGQEIEGWSLVSGRVIRLSTPRNRPSPKQCYPTMLQLPPLSVA